MATLEDVLEELRSKAKSDQLDGMARYGITGEHRMGVSVPDMRAIAKVIGQDHQLALALWDTGIPEAMIVAGMVADPDQLTEGQMEDWVVEINSWDICDQVCMNLFEKSPLVEKKIHDWSQREEEFVKRAAYALIACLAWHDKQASNETFTNYFPVIRRGASDNRNYVKKAVSWALRNIGKRNVSLNEAALEAARGIQQIDAKSSRWIASDVIRELESEKVQARLKAKS
jgi:3-methyladenine DNA glycosylase AlkD